MHAAFYDPTLSFEDNYTKGPPINFQNISLPKRNITKTEKFLGFAVNVPFGIPAGPLPNSKFIQAAFSFGFDVVTYKTVRAQAFPSHSFPNILYLDAPAELHTDKTARVIGRSEADVPIEMLSITNSFGVPSMDPKVWQQDVKKSLEYVGHGQLFILSFMGTSKPHQTEQELLEDFVLTARLSKETGAKVLEVNLACPNIGNEGLVCYNLTMTEKVTKAIRKEIGNIPLILKVGYYANQKDLEKIAWITQEYANAIAVVNALQVEVVDENGNQALPGKNRLKSGICGATIKWAGLEMVERLNKIRKEKKMNYEIVGMGGVMTTHDYFEYRKAGADCVQSATGAIWNANLAHDIWKKENR